MNKNKVAVVDPKKCKGCKICVKSSPRHLITMEEYDDKFLNVVIRCENKEKGKDARKVCENSCIACGICQRQCPVEAIEIKDFLAEINSEICIDCGACEMACPRNSIWDMDGFF